MAEVMAGVMGNKHTKHHEQNRAAYRQSRFGQSREEFKGAFVGCETIAAPR
jgi:hypothetical protein